MLSRSSEKTSSPPAQTLTDKIESHARAHGNAIDTDALSQSFSNGDFTNDELKIWVENREFDKAGFIENKHINAPDLVEAFKKIAKDDPKWALRFYYTQMRGIKMMSQQTGGENVDVSWIPEPHDFHIDFF